MSNQESGPSKFELAKTLADELGQPRGIEKLLFTGRVVAHGEDTPSGSYNPFTDVIVERPRLVRAIGAVLPRIILPYSMNLRKSVMKHGGRFREGKITIIKPAPKE